MDEPRTPESDFLLVTRTSGKSASRYQRAFRTRTEVERAVERRVHAGADAFWIYGPLRDDGALRKLERHWTVPTPQSDPATTSE